MILTHRQSLYYGAIFAWHMLLGAVLAIAFSNCATITPRTSLCKDLCAEWRRTINARGPVMSVADRQTCACIEPDQFGDHAPRYYSEPLTLTGDEI